MMLRIFVLVGLFSFSGAAFTQTFDYNFVQGSYGQFDFDNGDGDGFGIGGSVALSDRFHLFGAYSTADLDFGVEANGFDVGLGYNMAVSDAVDLIASLAYVSAEFEIPGFGSVDDDGYGLGLRLRAMATPALEVSGGIDYVDLGGSSDGDTSFGAGFLYHFSEAFAAGVSGDWSDDVNVYQLNGRFSFGD